MGEKFLMKGNEALAQAAIQAGCRHFFGYPITPQTEISAYMSKVMPKIGGTYLQAESEVAAINMVLGAASAGVRTMTSSSSPGISLKAEGLSYIAASDLPCLIVNVQRGGPGLGSIQPSQADYWQATRAAGHGDFHLLVYAPCTVQEMINIVFGAFETSEKYRIPAMILADGMLGQMMEPVEFPELEAKPLDKPWATNGHQHKRPSNLVNSLFLETKKLEEMVLGRYERYETVKENEVLYDTHCIDDAEIILIAYGITYRVAKSAVNKAREKGIKIGMLRPITLWPFPNKEIAALAQKDTVKSFMTAELNMGQMVDDVRLAVNGKKPVEYFGRTGGIVPNPEEIYEKIVEMAGIE